MTPIERFDPVIFHADKRQQQALQDCVLSQNQLAIEKNKLQQLQNYKAGYLNQSGQVGPSCLVITLQEFHRFLAQLDDAINQQQACIQSRESELQYKRQIWLSQRTRANIMHRFVENLQQGEQVELRRREQRSMDELSRYKIQRR